VWLFETSNVIQLVYGNTSTAAGMPVNSLTGGYSIGLASSASDYISVSSSSNTASSVSENNANTVAIAYQASYRFTPPAATGIPNPAAGLSPGNGLSGLTINTVLTWTSGGGAPSGYDVYFGTVASPP